MRSCWGGCWRRRNFPLPSGDVMVKLRAYRSEDCPLLLRLFYDTVHTVNVRNYTEEQCNVWATGQEDAARWNASLLAHTTVVAEWDGRIAGFGDMDDTGYLDRLYVSKDHQGLGIATAICEYLEQTVKASVYTIHASITAKPFFLRQGYNVVREQQVERRGVMLTNYVMEKPGWI